MKANKMEQKYCCDYCLQSVLLYNKKRHENSKRHLYNKKNVVLLNSENMTKDEITNSIENANNEGKTFHLTINNNKIANLSNIQIIDSKIK